MNNIKKQSTLSQELITSIRYEQMPLIMDKINEPKTSLLPRLSLRRGMVLVTAFIMVLITVSLWPSETVPPTPHVVTFDEFMEDLRAYQMRMEEILGEEIETEGYLEEDIMLALNPDYIISRQSLIQQLEDRKIDIVQEDVSENFINAKMEYDSVVGLLETYDDMPFNEWITIDNREFGISGIKILEDEDGSAFIVIEQGFEAVRPRSVIKVGLNEDLLEFERITFSTFPVVSVYGAYNYFGFKEGDFALYVSVRDYYVSVEYTNTKDDSMFQYYYNKFKDTRFLTHKDGETGVMSMVHLDSEYNVISESYHIYDEYGQVFGYEHVLGEDEVNIGFGLLYATGWDFLYNDPNIPGQNGIYNDSGKIFEPGTEYYYNGGKFISLSVGFTVDKNTITNEMLNLSEYGLEFYNSQMDTDYIDSILIRDISRLQEMTTLDGHIFIGNDPHEIVYLVINHELVDIVN